MVKGLKDKNKTKQKNSEEEEKGKKKKTWEKCLLPTTDQKDSISPKKLPLNHEGRLSVW